MNHCLPSGGWGPCWAGDPERGFGKRQPGGWIYSILPYIEQEQLFELGRGNQTTGTGPGSLASQVLQCVGTPLTVLICPSRRPAVLYPHASPGGQPYHYRLGDVTWPALAGKTDYAANGGTTGDGTWFQSGPANYADADSWSGADWAGKTGKPVNHVLDTGVAATHSAFTMADITDGTSNTYLIGEKYCDPDHYLDGTSAWDDQSWDIGEDWDIIRWSGVTGDPSNASFMAMQDTPGLGYGMSFGSAHAAGFYMGFCDGSVQFIRYEINLRVHWCLGCRNDDQPIDAQRFEAVLSHPIWGKRQRRVRRAGISVRSVCC